MKLYGLKNCDMCRKARRALEAAGRQVDFIDLRASPLGRAELLQLLDAFGAERLVNKKSTTWRQLDAGQRQMPAPDLLCAHPALMKRPVILDGEKKYLGWTDQVQHDCLAATDQGHAP